MYTIVICAVVGMVLGGLWSWFQDHQKARFFARAVVAAAFVGALVGTLFGVVIASVVTLSLPKSTSWQVADTAKLARVEGDFLFRLVSKERTEYYLFCTEMKGSGFLCQNIVGDKKVAVIEEEGQAVVTTYDKKITSGDPGAWKWGVFTDRSDEYEYERKYEFHITPGTMRDIKLE